MTTLMQQYTAIKAKYPDAILLFRAGDFYETFNRDAEIVSCLLDVILVKTPDKEIKANASIVHYSVDNAMRKLMKAGYCVALCEQLQEPKPGRMIRGVTNGFSSHRA
jgi:DNA mismatch repair protein MutS